MYILAIETSCDETSVAIAKGDLASADISVLSNIVSSQVKIHAEWGGVVPNLAAREHLKNITPVMDQALEAAKLSLADIDLLAVTQGPGLIPALLIGTNMAKTLAYYLRKPLLGVHHIEGHIYANLESLPSDTGALFPVLALVVSGGHTQLVLMRGHLEYEILGQTLDDAAGEAFDKVAKIMELGYPGGPIVSQRAARARQMLLEMKDQTLKTTLIQISFPRPLLQKQNLDFSFSGLKTAVLYFYRNLDKHLPNVQIAADAETKQEAIKDVICMAAEDAITDVLVKKTLRAAKQFSPRTVMLAGGVAANSHLRQRLEQQLKEHYPAIRFIKPKLEYCGDNAAMIAIAAFYRFRQLKKNAQLHELDENWKTLEANANLKLS